MGNIVKEKERKEKRNDGLIDYDLIIASQQRNDGDLGEALSEMEGELERWRIW